MWSKQHVRVLVVCGGNSCRSPVLSLLLAAELHRIGRDDVEVLSAGASEHYATHPPYAGPMNEFAKEALRETLVPHNDVHSHLMRRACAHHSKGLSKFAGKHFDLVAFLVEHRSGKLRRWGIVAKRVVTEPIRDHAFGVWKREGSPKTLKGDRSGKVLPAYRQQTALLMKHAVKLASRLAAITN